jgi:hypothetical protein
LTDTEEKKFEIAYATGVHTLNSAISPVFSILYDGKDVAAGILSKQFRMSCENQSIADDISEVLASFGCPVALPENRGMYCAASLIHMIMCCKNHGWRIKSFRRPAESVRHSSVLI